MLPLLGVDVDGGVEVVGDPPGLLVVVVPPVLPVMPNQARSTVSWTGTVWPTFTAE
jgi:hypothetical protein